MHRDPRRPTATAMSTTGKAVELGFGAAAASSSRPKWDLAPLRRPDSRAQGPRGPFRRPYWRSRHDGTHSVRTQRPSSRMAHDFCRSNGSHWRWRAFLDDRMALIRDETRLSTIEWPSFVARRPEKLRLPGRLRMTSE